METFFVRGGAPLVGAVPVSGAKNSALKLAAASMLSEGRWVLHNVPDIADIHSMMAVLTHLGVGVQQHEDTCVLDVPAEVGLETPAELVAQLRASIVVLGPLLARAGWVRVAQPGGCNLGSRNIDMHLAGLTRMGAEITYGDEHVEARAERLVGADIELPFPSVGATENLLLAGVTADGVTRIHNAAREPEIADLAGFLSAAGADISGAGTSEITVRGVSELTPVAHHVVPDRIEAGTYALGAAVTGGRIRLEGTEPGHLSLVTDKLRAAGAEVSQGRDWLEVAGPERPVATDVVTLPYPGFPTDLQAQFLVLLSQATGTSMVTENVFDGRLAFVDHLARMGADVYNEGHHVIVRGPVQLQATHVEATDLRAGAALVLAGLVADGETVISGAHHVDRGYAGLAERLTGLGADVHRSDSRVPATAS
jgi:UDP-N-acetylglucosamine 1-carboxyvinyltransferase